MDVKLNLSFNNLSSEVKEKIFTKQTKKILKSISGEFKSQELSAIIGPSGCGKSSLLNAISGYRQNNVSGTIKLNNYPVGCDDVRKYSSYIMQENDLQDELTVNESLIFAARLKNVQKSHKKVIESVLKSLSLDKLKFDFIRTLSGGQKKRLSIALELIDNPSILFLDECTTGLDSSSAFQCVKMLKNLSKEGRTIICSIHQPSPKVFTLFDQIYALAEGSCVYQGSPENLIKFFCDVNLPCPINHSLCDFLIEIASNEYGSQISVLNNVIENGINDTYKKPSKNNKIQQKIYKDFDSIRYPLPSIFQIKELVKRNSLISYRTKLSILLRLASSLLVGFLIGITVDECSDDAKNTISCTKLYCGLQLFIFTTSIFSNVTKIPEQFNLLKRERFNRCYSESSYVAALIISDAPVLIACSILLITVSYFLTGQPPIESRLLPLLLVSSLNSLAASGVGMMLSAYLDVITALVLGGFSLAPFIMFSVPLSFKDVVSDFFKPLFRMNFHGRVINSHIYLMYGRNRTSFNCYDKMFCAYKDPKFMMKILGVEDSESELSDAILICGIFIFVTSILTFLQVKYRLQYK